MGFFRLPDWRLTAERSNIAINGTGAYYKQAWQSEKTMEITVNFPILYPLFGEKLVCQKPYRFRRH